MRQRQRKVGDGDRLERVSSAGTPVGTPPSFDIVAPCKCLISGANTGT